MILAKYLSAPYVFGGRDFSGCDCFGLVSLYFKHELGIILFDAKSGDTGVPGYSGSQRMIENVHVDFERVDEAKKNRIILFDAGDFWHCGVMIDDSVMLQTDVSHQCTAIKLTRMPMAVHSIYQHRGLSA